MDDEEFRRWTEQLSAKWAEHDRRLEEEKRAEIEAVQGLGPLPRRKAPLPWEDLASLISRTAEAMGYPTPGWILHPESAKHSIAPKDLAWLSMPLDYRMLGRLLDLDKAGIRALTLRRFALKQGMIAEGTSAPADLQASGTVEQAWLFNPYPLFRSFQSTIQVCPRCLDEAERYDRLYWRATPLLLCPRHHVFLIQACPACQRPIPAPRARPSACPSCGADYRQLVLPLAAEGDWLLNTHLIFLTQLGVDTGELGALPADDESSFLQQLPQSQYWWIVANFLDLFDDPLYRTSLVRALPVAKLVPGAPQSPYLVFHYLLASWPLHWWVLLERFHYTFAFRRAPLWWGPPDDPIRRWRVQLGGEDCWRQEVDKERTLEILHAFFGAAERHFQLISP